ncbi:solute carrier family 22 member 18 isoform X2 [Takifugu rubripes]|uniref:solute carrier family 22 member 18 isoform X2 n=1 Tax=Takifugu rubripes TaxID=31033 RepID=UPI000298ED5F|nr:solute carrier family 22 member 18 isoform X2 [Takifugu rubripes]|eukprot:XP_003969813.1 PREDICTED: solute carrier family 22 member 18 isoform X2 [Takifugu rubripes]
MNRKVQLSDETSSQNNTVDKRNRGKIIQVVYIIAALDITWMFLQFSITPYLAKKLGFDTLWFGYLQTMVGFCQLFGGPLFGRFGDLFGARTALSVACSSSVVFFLLLAAANHPAMLFIHKLPTLLMHIIPTSQMVVTDLSEPEKRADALSKLGLCFGVGMIAGSTLGGHLNTRYGEKITACVGAAGSFFSLLLVLKFIPKNTKVHASTATANGSDKKTSIFSVDQITRLMKFPGVARTFIVKIAVSLPSGIFQVMFSIIALEFFKLQPEENGYLMAFFGIVQMVIQGGVIGRMTARFSESSLLLLSVGVSALVGLGQANMQTVFHLCLTIIPMMFSLSMFNVITDSMLTKSVPSSDTGTMLGLCSSVQSLLRTVGPTIGGFLYVNFGLPSIGTVQFVMNVAVFTYLLRRHLKNTDEQKE